MALPPGDYEGPDRAVISH